MLFFKEVVNAPGWRRAAAPGSYVIERPLAKEAAFQAWQRRVSGGCWRVSTSLNSVSNSVLSCCLELMSWPQANRLQNGRAMLGRRTEEAEVRRIRRAFLSVGGLSPRKGDFFAILMCRAVCTVCFSIMAFGLVPLQFLRTP